MKHFLVKVIFLALLGAALALLPVTSVFANTSPNGPGQPGAPGTTCQTYTTTPGKATNANGSPFNPSGQAGNVYAGNPGTASSSHSNSTHSVSQYDVACFQGTSH